MIRTRYLTAGTLALLTGSACSQTDPAGSFKDPGPPTVHALAKIDPPAPKTYPGLRFAKPPKKLHAEAVTEDWPGFLGPRRNCHSGETHLLKNWPVSGPAVVWEMERGEGYACPAVVGDRLVYTHRRRDEAYIDCLQASTGKRFWRFRFPCSYVGEYIRNSGPRSSPEISGNRVFVHAVNGRLFCLELTTGRVIWQRDMQKEFRTPDDFFGVVSTPLVFGDLLIQNIGAPDGPCVAAFDKATGKLVWGAGDKWGPSCASPIHGMVHGRQRVFVLAGGESRPPTGGLMVLDPKSGAADFEYPFRSRTYTSVTASTPTVGDNWVFLSSSYGVGSHAVTLEKDGGHRQRWRNRKISLQFSNAVLQGGHLYAIDGVPDRGGAIVCLDPATGKSVHRTDLVWDETLEIEGSKQTVAMGVGEGSLTYADGAFLCLGDNGHLLCLDATPKHTKVLARTWLFRARECWTPLVISRGLLYVCQNNRERWGGSTARLICYDLRGD
ncbi:MAG: PQQ-binding-like beta-propeller repeat protein [Planctomycetota bacterium]|nr:PQQ-binding-like beta-propeller repeat protein [Planctomycetota bacterium]